MSDTARERAIVALAGELAGRNRRRHRVPVAGLAERTVAGALADEAFRAHLFRVVDAYPALAGAREVAEHIDSEFEGVAAPWWFRAGVTLGRAPGGAGLLSAVTATAIDRMARRFVAGTSPEEIAASAGRLWDGGVATTVDLLGEHTYSDAEAARYAARLATLVDALAKAAPGWPARPLLEADDLGPVPRASVSVKISALSPAFAPLTAERGLAEAEAHLVPILERAAAGRLWVWFDMERYAQKALTLALFRRLLERPELQGLQAGIVLQAYLRDAPEDLEALAEWARGRPVPVGVRLVKGAYWDSETVHAAAMGWEPPVHTDKAATDLAFESMARRLHELHGTLRAAFASHNLRSLAAAVVDGRRAGIPDDGYELQLLHGMAPPLHDAVREAGFRLRVYAPMGELVPGMAYLVRRLLENTSNDSFVRHAFAEHQPLAALVAAPVPSAAEAGPAPRRRRGTRRPVDAVQPPGAYRPEPPAEWHRAEVRARLAEAVAAEFARSARRVVPSVPGVGEGEIVSVDPADPGTVVAVAPACTDGQVAEAVGRAVAARPAWSREPVARRAEVLVRAAAVLRRRRVELTALEVREVGKGWADADADVCEAIDYCEYYARRMLVLDAGGEVQSPPGERNLLRYRGRGVCAVIAPWNFPLAIATGMTTAALVAGNAVVLKPAEQSPAVAVELVAALAEAGLPEGVLQFVTGAGETGAALVAHPAVDVIAFTGSRQVGLGIVEVAGRRDDRRRSVTRVIAEMGGKNAVVVDDDADLDEVVPAVLHSAFGFAGQKCSAASRLVAVDRVYDAVVERVVEASRSLAVGPSRLPANQVGPVIDAEAHERLTGAIARARREFDVVLERGDVPDDGFFVGPTVVAGADPDSWLATEELFGPVLAVFRVPDFAAGLSLANRSDYALTAGVFTRSAAHIRRATEELRAGNVYVNRPITGAVVGRQPFGGSGLSGVGSKAGGPDYLLQFCDPQVTTENTVRQGFAADT